MRYRISIEFDALDLEDADHYGGFLANSAKAFSDAKSRRMAAGPIEQQHVYWSEPTRPEQS